MTTATARAHVIDQIARIAIDETADEDLRARAQAHLDRLFPDVGGYPSASPCVLQGTLGHEIPSALAHTITDWRYDGRTEDDA